MKSYSRFFSAGAALVMSLFGLSTGFNVAFADDKVNSPESGAIEQQSEKYDFDFYKSVSTECFKHCLESGFSGLIKISMSESEYSNVAKFIMKEIPNDSALQSKENLIIQICVKVFTKCFGPLGAAITTEIIEKKLVDEKDIINTTFVLKFNAKSGKWSVVFVKNKK